MNPQDTTTPAGMTGAGNMETPGSRTDARHKIADTAKAAAAKVKTAASQTMHKAREQAEHYATEKRDTAADRIGGYSSSIHDSARSFEEKDPNIAWFTHQAAEKLDHLANYVRGANLERFREDAHRCASQRPVAYFGGMFVAGLILGNLLKASGRKVAAESGADGNEQAPAMEADPNLALTDPTSTATWGGA
jgi:hypothetical protein